MPGNSWTGAQSWNQTWYGTPNSEVMSTIQDPLNHFSFELHQYFDSNYSGEDAECQSANVGVLVHREHSLNVQGLEVVTPWLRSLNATAYLGEFAVGPNALCLTALNNLLSYMETNSDIWKGWTYWAAGK